MTITIKVLMIVLFLIALVLSAATAFIFFRMYSIILVEVQALRAELADVKSKAEDLYKESELVRFLKQLRLTAGGTTE